MAEQQNVPHRNVGTGIAVEAEREALVASVAPVLEPPPPDAEQLHDDVIPLMKRERPDEGAAANGACPATSAPEKEDSMEPEKGESGKQAPRHPLWKTSLCSYFRRQNGTCSHGDACRYAHSEEELLPRPDNSWDPNSQRAKKLKISTDKAAAAAAVGGKENGCCVTVNKEEDMLECSEVCDITTLDKCLIGLPMKWTTDNLKNFLNSQDIPYKTANKKKGMALGFLTFVDVEQVKYAYQELNGKHINRKHIKLAEVNHKLNEKKLSCISSDDQIEVSFSDCQSEKNPCESMKLLDGDSVEENCMLVGCAVTKTRSARDVATPLADMAYNDQLEHKKNLLLQTLKRLTRNARKACPSDVPIPDWAFKAREIGGLPCKFEGILESPQTSGYRNKCEFSIGYSSEGKKTVGFMLGNFRDGVTAVEEPIGCPNISNISCKYALIFQEFLQSSDLPLWNRVDNVGFWRQFTVREGRKSDMSGGADNAKGEIAEVMLIVQVCTVNADTTKMNSEFKKMSEALAQGASECSPPLPLTSLVVQDHKGISNAAPADCPLLPLPIPLVGKTLDSELKKTSELRIHDHINNLRFSISPTAFFQVNTLAAEKLYSLAGDWANLDSDTLLFDVCCGTGTIGLTLAHRVGLVVGIELNDAAVSDAQRNADINGIKNCRFVCGKAEDVMGDLLKDYLDMPLQKHEARSGSSDKEDVKVDGSTEWKLSECGYQKGNSEHKQNNGALISSESLLRKSGTGSQSSSSSIVGDKFKNVVAIVDPPRGGLHPNVIKTIRTHPCLRRLVYISCNPETLVANAIELCTPTSEQPQKGKVNNRGWRNATSASLARHRAKHMPNSEPFRPVKAMAVDLFPHTPHCEMVMLMDR